jgi:hypothetical protein
MPSLSDFYRIISDFGNFLEAHNGAISAVSAVFVAAFTYTLWRATTRLWRTSQEHAKHLERSVVIAEQSLVALNRPYLLFHQPQAFTMSSLIDPNDPRPHDELVQIAQSTPNPTIYSTNINVGYSLINRGRTVAIIHSSWSEIYVGETLPSPEYASYFDDLKNYLDRPKIIRTYIIADHHASPDKLQIKLDDPVKCALFNERKESLFLYGFVRYSDMFVRKTYITGRALKREGLHFVTVENEIYNYDSEEDEMRKRLGLPMR